MFARETAACATSSSLDIPSSQADRTLNSTGTDPNDRAMTTGALEPSVLMSPDRKRSFEMDHDPSPLVGFSDTELDDTTIQIHNPHTMVKKTKTEDYSVAAATIPDLPRLNDDMVRT